MRVLNGSVGRLAQQGVAAGAVEVTRLEVGHAFEAARHIIAQPTNACLRHVVYIQVEQPD